MSECMTNTNIQDNKMENEHQDRNMTTQSISDDKKMITKENKYKQNESEYNNSSSEDDITTSDSDYDPNDDENNGLDVQEYRKFLYKLYPSQHLNKKIKSFDSLKEKLEQKNDNISDSDTVSNTTNESDEEEDSEMCSETLDDSDIDDSDYDTEDTEKLKNIMKDGMKFNIVFNVGRDSEYDDTESESDNDDEDQDENTESEEEEETEHIVKQTNKTKQKNVKQENEKKNNTKKQKTTVNEKVKTNKEKEHNKKRIDPVVSCDSDTEQEFKKMIELCKNKKENKELPNEVYDKFNQYLEKCKKKYEKEKKQKEKKMKVKNNKLFKKYIRGSDRMNDYRYFKGLEIKKQNEIIEKLKTIQKYNIQEKPYRIQLVESSIPDKYKAEVLKKINSLNTIDQGSGEYYKVKQWIDTFMKIPFNTYKNLPVKLEDGIATCNEFMEKSKTILNEAVYGLDDAKLQIMQMMGQWISNPQSVGSAIAIKGPMGTGKTTLVKEGISKILNRPFFFIALGGATDSSFLEGHSYTYEGSVWGKIVDILIQSKCMNPVIYFDELDKVSSSPRGEEIIGILTHLTDTSQNNEYHDKYFSGIDFDLSKALFIFSYNDEEKVNKILKDRMYRIQTEGYNKKQKITIARNYLIPSIERNINFKKGDITFDEEALSYIIDDLTENEKGVRNLKRCIEIVFTKLNLFRFMKPETEIFKDTKTFSVELPYQVTKETVETLIKKEKGDELYKHIYV